MRLSRYQLILAICSVLVGVPVLAQPANVTAGSGETAATTYRPAFEGYRPFKDEPVASWRESNELVGRIGGWKAYAREGQGLEPAKIDASSVMPKVPVAPGAQPEQRKQ